jgi:hypothetical protein
MIDQGYPNVKTVQGGGRTMEKFFDYYRGGKIVRPMTGDTINTDLYEPKKHKFKY